MGTVPIWPADTTFDLVRLDNASFFVPTGDNLYNLVIPEACKHLTLAEHQRFTATSVLPPADALARDPTYLLLGYLDQMDEARMFVDFHDVGAWIGDMAIRMARFAYLKRAPFRATCYDPSLAGSLIPLNAELNGVGVPFNAEPDRRGELVRYRPVAMNLTSGVAPFLQFHGHSDASRLAAIGPGAHAADAFLVLTTTLAQCLPIPDHWHQIVKLDVEGLEALLIQQARDRLTDATLIVEFAPGQDQYQPASAPAFVRDLMTTHTLFDLGYAPRPWMAARVTDADTITGEAMTRPYNYTDLLAVPHSLPLHDSLVAWLDGLDRLPMAYRLAW